MEIREGSGIMRYKVWLTLDHPRTATDEYAVWGSEPEYTDLEWRGPRFLALGLYHIIREYFPLKRHMKGGPKSIKVFEVTVKEVKE